MFLAITHAHAEGEPRDKATVYIRIHDTYMSTAADHYVHMHANLILHSLP